MTQTPELLPVKLVACPFCGAAQAVDQCDMNGAWVEKNDQDDPEFHVHCWSCGARTMDFYDRDKAVEAWNTRSHTIHEPASVMREEAAIVRALERLERANDAVCGARTEQQYLGLIDGGQKDLLIELDHARRDARDALAALRNLPLSDEVGG